VDPGADLIALRDRVGRSGSVLGIDSSEHMVANARERIGADNANIDLKIADAHALPFQSGHVRCLPRRSGLSALAESIYCIAKNWCE